jgi:beta-lactamase class A
MHAQPLADAASEVQSTLDAVDGTFAVAARVVGDTSRSLLLNARHSGHAASTMKVPVMVELYRQAHAGRFALDDSIRVKNDFRSIVDGSPYSLDPADDSHTALYDQLGERRPIRALMRDMITASSNLATNILIEKVGAERVTRTMERYGADGLQVRRGVEDMKAYRQGLNNTTTAHALMVLFERIARGEAVSETASDEMIEILRAQAYNDMIPARLPDGVEVAHKTGWITGVRHDAGIVSVPGGPTYVLVLLSWDLEDPEAGVEALAQVSRIVYDAVRGE